MQHYLEYVFFQLAKWLVLSLPLKSAQRLGTLLGDLGYHVASSRREVALDNLRHAFPEKSEKELIKIVKGAFRNYGMMFTEMLWFPNLNGELLEKLISMDQLSIVHTALAEDKGMILVSGHFGNWELGAIASGYYFKQPMLLLVLEQSNKLVDVVIDKHRRLFGNRTVTTGMAVREVIKTLEQKGIVAIAADQSAAKERIHILFFGRSVATHEGPAVFSLRTGAPIVMQFLVRQPDFTYKTIFERVNTDNLPTDNEEAVIELTKRHTKILENHIRQYPDHWLWMHRRWKHTEEITAKTASPHAS